jgi:four helix bundle protein
MRDFKKYTVWQDAMQVCKACYELIKHMPDEVRYGLRSQITRAAISIPSNIAEGSARSSDKEFKRFLEIALGSSFELETQLMLATDLGLLSAAQTEAAMDKLNSNQAGMNALIQKLK